jgi:hypothetical protein
METLAELQVPLSRKKRLLMAVGSMAFVALGIGLLQMDAKEIRAMSRFSPILVHGVGVVAAMFFGACSVYVVRKLFDNKPGLVLNTKGLQDNSSGVAAGFIPWPEIEAFKLYEVFGQRMLVVMVTEPQKYVARGGAIRKRLNVANMRMCGSPVVISSNALNIDFDTLVSRSEQFLAAYRATTL